MVADPDASLDWAGSFPDREVFGPQVEGDTLASPAHDFYGAHAEVGHAPEWNGAGGIDCGSCGEHYGPQPQPETEPEAG
jgi:hypothetical protein